MPRSAWCSTPSQGADLEAWNEAPNGTGPFVFVSRDLDNETIVEKNPNYWGVDADGVQLPYLDQPVVPSDPR